MVISPELWLTPRYAISSGRVWKPTNKPSVGTGLSQTIIAMITSNVSRAGHPSRVFVNIATPEGKQTGLITDSVIMTDNLATVLDTEIDKVIGF